jgi:APA family basic amino acid/polyamine antiporter
MVGSGVFLKARVMTCAVDTPLLVLGVWIVGGLLSAAGALTYAELAAMMPRAGGEYVFIREAYGRFAAFLFGWMRFFIGNGGGLAALASAFGIFFNVLTAGALAALAFSIPLPGGYAWRVSGIEGVAAAAILVVAIVNCASVRWCGRIASVTTVLKVALVAGLGIAAMTAGAPSWAAFTATAAGATCDGVAAGARGGLAGFGAALLAAMWAYNGWNELTYVAGEVERPGRNLPLALLGGLGITSALYVFVNASYFAVLSPADVASTPLASSVATEAVARMIGPAAAGVMAGVLVVSVLSTMQVVVLVAARIPFAMAQDGLFFAPLARVSQRTHVPVLAVLAQAGLAMVLVVSGSFDALTDYAVFAILLFGLLIGGSIFVMRRRYPDAERPYRAWGYPVVPLLFLLVTGWLLANTLMTSPRSALAGLALMAFGVPFYAYWSRRTPPVVEPGGVVST